MAQAISATGCNHLLDEPTMGLDPKQDYQIEDQEFAGGSRLTLQPLNSLTSEVTFLYLLPFMGTLDLRGLCFETWSASWRGPGTELGL